MSVSHWITDVKRLAIYLRDGLACSYCGATLESGVKLTLDHLKPRSEGGTHHHRNLTTACHSCNSKRGKDAWSWFASMWPGSRARIEQRRRRRLPIKRAKKLISVRTK